MVEKKYKKFHLPFGQVMQRAAVEQNTLVNGAVVQHQAGVIDEAGKEGWLQKAEDPDHNVPLRSEYQKAFGVVIPPGIFNL